ncbi:type IV secretory system conjugative DNA transfer family protein [Magnetospira sp. QH-2]|uniref:type IV secretory system conjugative DNA transfer family protein n=1 Tax=Magnetospira sp. (strain QH-2) TaxID=1288970 RepID=UPI0003E816CA|nr:type IV secretory system conjugative DNA transfer family protein [Magnetospira sp. QH-2]CCQ74250.1 Protein of unknown function [Magnetospira sp. QH-2]
MELLIIFALAAVAFVAYTIWHVWGKGDLEDHPAYRQARMKEVAKHFAKGGKPFGEPLGGTSHGSAYFLNTQQLIDKNLADGSMETIIANRLFLGQHTTQRTVKGKKPTLQAGLVYAPNEGHLLTVAPTRSGKGTSHIIPNLLNYRGSVIVNDIKGENYAITKRWREEMDHKVLRFAPFHNDSASWNPLDFVQPGIDAWENAAVLADLLITPTRAISDFWDNIGRNLLRGVILHVVTYRPANKRNMAEVRRMLADTGEELAATMDEMVNSEEELVRRAGNAFLTRIIHDPWPKRVANVA